MIARILCRLGWHAWKQSLDVRYCKRCKIGARYNFNAERWEVER